MAAGDPYPYSKITKTYVLVAASYDVGKTANDFVREYLPKIEPKNYLVWLNGIFGCKRNHTMRLYDEIGLKKL